MPSTNIRQNATIILFFALLSISGILFMAINTGQRFGPLPPLYRVSFQVRDADGLVEGSDVRIAGIPVGKVMAIATTAEGARVDLGIDPGKGYDPIYTDGVVLIRPKSLLGEKYVDLQRGTSNVEIPDGGMLPMSQAFTQVEVDQVLNSSDPATRKALSANITTLGEGFANRGQDINPTIPELRRIAEHLTPVSARFKDRTAQIDHILVDTDTILTTLADEHAQLATLLQSADSVTTTIAQNDNHLAGLLNNGGDLFSKFNLVFSQQNSDQQIRASLEQAPALLTKLNTFLDLTGHDINSVVPSLLLGQQFNYPNDQLTVAIPSGLQTDKEWDSAFRWFDTGPGGTGISPKDTFHGFAAMGVQCQNGPPNAPYPYPCPGKNAGYGATTASSTQGGNSGSAPQSSLSPAASAGQGFSALDLQRAFLDYLLGQ
jgi:phospholipid/cholesterol/gamma-HCH transport system substrate-binding protein